MRKQSKRSRTDWARVKAEARTGAPVAFDPKTDPYDPNDPKAALTGSLTAIGGVKGAALALMVEVLTVALTGAAFSFENDSYFEPGNKPRIGHAILAINPDALAGAEAYFSRLETMVSKMLADDGVRLPGTRRQQATAKASAEGLEIPNALHQELKTLAGSRMK